MAKYNIPSLTPPGKWWYFQKETRLRIEGEDLIDLKNKVAAHRKYKQLGRLNDEEVWRDIEQQTCERLGSQHCSPEEGEQWQPMEDITQNISMEEIKAFTRAFVEWITSGAELAAKQEAESRAEICRGCQFNVPAKGCWGCEMLYKVAEAAIPADRQIEGVNVCAICGCGLKAKVNVPFSVVEESNRNRNLKYPSYCWQNTNARS